MPNVLKLLSQLVPSKIQATLNSLNVRHFDKLLGLFSESHMQYHLLNDKKTEPTLMEMTQKALQMVSKNPKGFVLMVESGRIDHGHHEGRAKLAFEETKHFHDVVQWVQSEVDLSKTLIVVTADHSHTMSISGHPKSKCICVEFNTSAESTDLFLSQGELTFFHSETIRLMMECLTSL